MTFHPNAAFATGFGLFMWALGDKELHRHCSNCVIMLCVEVRSATASQRSALMVSYLCFVFQNSTVASIEN